MQMTTVVTGATGNVGSQVVRELRDRGVPLRAFVRDPTRAAERLGHDVELAVGDFSEAASVRRAMEGADALLLACANHPCQVAYETTAIDAAAAAGVRRIVKLSTIGAEVGSPLAFWDWQGRIERHLARSGVPAVVLRSNFYMSNLLAAAEPVRREGKLVAPAGGARIAMIDPRDVAAVAAVALTADGHDGRTYVLTGPEAITYERVAEELSVVAGRRVEFVDAPDEATRQGLLATGAPEWFAENLVTLYGILRQGAAAQATGTVRALTGREPRSFGEFARDHAALFASSPPGQADSAVPRRSAERHRVI
jgi:uncharacterized protein YbjT (DUF2867 family)